jgi:hypothetical protein
LGAKNVVLASDKDITMVLRDIVNLSKKVKCVDLLKVLNHEDNGHIDSWNVCKGAKKKSQLMKAMTRTKSSLASTVTQQHG